MEMGIVMLGSNADTSSSSSSKLKDLIKGGGVRKHMVVVVVVVVVVGLEIFWTFLPLLHLRPPRAVVSAYQRGLW
jgi:hypothetical protein